MARTILALSVVALVALTAGCRMCAHPYDDCGPLFTGDSCGPPCAPHARAGSVLQGGCPSCGGAGLGGPVLASEMPVPAGEMPVLASEMMLPAPLAMPIEGEQIVIERADPVQTHTSPPPVQAWRPIQRR